MNHLAKIKARCNGVGNTLIDEVEGVGEEAFALARRKTTPERLAPVMQADIKQANACGHHKLIKRQKNRLERKRARENPECVPGYGKYRGWES